MTKRCDWCCGPNGNERWQVVDGWAFICATCSGLVRNSSRTARNRRKPQAGPSQTLFPFMSNQENGPGAVQERPSRKDF
jgi:hypothetical protein